MTTLILTIIRNTWNRWYQRIVLRLIHEQGIKHACHMLLI